MYSDKQLLIGKWFLNVKKNIVNEEILLLSSTENISLESVKHFVHKVIPETTKPTGLNSYFDMTFRFRNEESKNNTITSKILKSQYLTESYSIHILNSENMDIINQIRNYKNKTKNLIVVTSNNYHYSDYARPLLYLQLQSEILEKNHFLPEKYADNLNDIVNHNLHSPNIPFNQRYLYYIEMLPIVSIIKNKQFNTIANFISYYINQKSYIPIDINILLEDTSYKDNRYHLIDLIEADIYLLSNYEILTSRLAIVMYRLSFLDLKAHKTKIGLFVKDNLKVQSKPINLKTITSEFINQDLNEKSFRGYILNKKTKSNEDIKLEIAKRLLKHNVDINIVSKATKLSTSKILKNL